MTIKTPMEIRAETDGITRAVVAAQSLGEIEAAKGRLAGIRAQVTGKMDEYRKEYGDEGVRSVTKQIYDTGVFIGLKEIVIKRNSPEQQRQLRALGYRV